MAFPVTNKEEFGNSESQTASPSLAQTQLALSPKEVFDLSGFERLSPSGCSSPLHFQEPTTIPSRPAMVYEDHRRTARVWTIA